MEVRDRAGHQGDEAGDTTKGHVSRKKKKEGRKSGKLEEKEKEKERSNSSSSSRINGWQKGRED